MIAGGQVVLSGIQTHVVFSPPFSTNQQLTTSYPGKNMKVLASLAYFAPFATAQQKLLQPQENTFNSTFTLTPEQIRAANLSEATAHNV